MLLLPYHTSWGVLTARQESCKHSVPWRKKEMIRPSETLHFWSWQTLSQFQRIQAGVIPSIFQFAFLLPLAISSELAPLFSVFWQSLVEESSFDQTPKFSKFSAYHTWKSEKRPKSWDPTETSLCDSKGVAKPVNVTSLLHWEAAPTLKHVQRGTRRTPWRLQKGALDACDVLKYWVTHRSSL